MVDKLNAKLDIAEIFESIYGVFGYNYYHPLYRTAKLTLFKAGEILEEAHIMATNTFSVEKLDQLLQSYSKPRAKYLFNNFQRDPTASQFPSTATKLRDNIILVAKNVPGNTFSNEHETKINAIFDEYLEQLAEYRIYNKILKGYEESYGNSYRLRLIRELLDKSRPLRQLLGRDMQEFNKLLFGVKTSALSEAFDLPGDSRVEHNTLSNIIFNSYDWTIKTFDSLGVSITYDELQQLRIDIQETIYKWIRLSSYKPPLVDQGLIRDSNPYMLELEMIYSLLFAARLKTGNSDLDFTGLFTQGIYSGKAYKSRLLDNLRGGHPFNTNSLRQFRDILNKWIVEESQKPNTDNRKTNSYNIAKTNIGMVARLTGRNIRGVVALRKGGKFNTPQAKVYNVILGLGRHLGFDSGFFRPIKDEMFDMTKELIAKFQELGLKIYRYARHHFGDSPDRTSLELMIQVLIDSRSHLYWDSMMSEDDGLVANQILENLIEYRRPITRTDIQNEFAKFPDEYLVIMETWFGDPEFKKNLKLFNILKGEIKTKPLDQFIHDNYPIAYARFFNTMLKEHRINVRKLIEEYNPYIDVSTLITLGTNDDLIGPYTNVFTQILKYIGYPVYF